MGSRRVFTHTRMVSLIAVSASVVLSLLFSRILPESSSTWQVWLAVGALAIGIPHGALDHLVTVPTMSRGKMTVFIGGYLAVVAVVCAAILLWPLWGFVGVVLMSAVHFGIGDAAFIRQSHPHSGPPDVPWWVYAVPAGAVPVIIPLTGAGSTDALMLVNPELVGWHGGLDGGLFGLTLSCAAIAVVWLVARRRFADARDLVALVILAVFTPPLVAFAAYFGLWHALRHTARLSGEIAPAREHAEAGRWVHALWRVSVPGTPALAGTLIVAAVITLWGEWELSQYLWITLALVWALTVPHMALTGKLDRAVLGGGAKTGSLAADVSVGEGSAPA